MKVSQPGGSQDQKQGKPGEDRRTPEDQTVILQRSLNSGHFKKAFAQNVFFFRKTALYNSTQDSHHQPLPLPYSHEPLPFHPGLILPDTFLHLTFYVVGF